MEKFAIDLDKVLDDFEESEDRAVQLDQKATIKDSTLMKNSLGHMPNVGFDNKLFYISHNVCESQLYNDHLEKLDLSEADFAAALKPSTLLSVPNHYNANTSCGDDVQKRSFQTVSENASVNIKNENVSERWASNLNGKSQPDVCTNADISTRHFANGFHIQNDEVLCISVQNTSEKKDSSSSSDIQIQLLPSFSSETNYLPKADSTKLVKTDEQVSNESLASTIQTLHEKQDFNEMEDPNKQGDMGKDEINFEQSEVAQLEEKAVLRQDDALEINTFDHNVSEKRGPDGTEEIKCYQDCVSESLDYILKMDKMQFLNKDGFYEEMMKQNMYSGSVREAFNSEQEIKNSDKCIEFQSNCSSSYTAFSNSIQCDKTEAPIGFSNVEPNEDDENVDIDDYLHDVLHITSEIQSANKNITKEYCENETNLRDHDVSPMNLSETNNNSDSPFVPSNTVPENCSDQKISEISFDGSCENLLEKSMKSLNDCDEISSQVEMIVENKNSSKTVDMLTKWENQDEIGTNFIVETMGVRPKATDCNANDNFEGKNELENELNVFGKTNDCEFSAKNEQFSYGEQLYEEVIIPVKCSENGSIDCEEEVFTQQVIESPKMYDKNGNITDTENGNPSLGLTDSSCFIEQEGLVQPTRLPRPTTLNLPVRVSMRPQVSSEFENLTTVDSSENLNELDGDANINQSSDDLNQEQQANEEQQQIGKIKPFWFPDTCTSNCMHCDSKFTVLKRRHHCRACGKVLCSQCCNQKTRLPYMDNKEARVCQLCLAILVRVQEQERLFNNNMPPSPSSGGSSPSLTPSVQSGSNSPGLISNQQGSLGWWPPNPNNPQEYCSTISPLQQVQPYLNCPPPTVLVPIGVLKRGGKPKGEPKQVMFSDGIRPGGDLTDQSELPDQPPPYRRQGRVQRRIDKSSTDNSPSANITDSGRKHKPLQLKSRSKRVVVCDSEGPLPSILLSPEIISEGKPDIDKLINWLADEKSRPVVFALTKNLHISAKIVTLDCCVGKDCWCFSSNGLNAVGQDEVMVAIERLPNENTVPRDIFRLFNSLYDDASKGKTVSDLGNSLFPEGILGSREHSGFLFVRHTFQCLDKLVTPSAPFLIALLIQKWEVPWAKVFPLRLMLRLGAEFRYYPCPLISVRYRKPVYCEIGHTIMNVLADFRNYQFTVQMIPGVVIHMEEKKTSVKLPRNTYEKVMKALSNSNDHVFALASNFSTEADSHLVCIQNEDGSYQTQAINIQNTPRRVTGSSFIVFSGALKASTGLSAKSSIVEDGLLVQIPSDNMSDLKNAIRDMKDFTIGCGLSNAQQPEEVILLQWTKDDKNFNLGVRSPIDNRSLEGVQSIRIHTGTDYAGEYHLIRWTEVFFLQMEEEGNKQQNEPTDPSRLAEAVAQACCQALSPHLQWLAEAQLTKIGLRVTLDSDKVGYDIGAAGEALPSMYMNALDSALIPVITCASTTNQEGPIILELIFHVLLK